MTTPRHLECRHPELGTVAVSLKSVAGVPDTLVAEHSLDGGKTWSPLPTQLSPLSALLNLVRRHWPATKLDALVNNNGDIVLSFRDPWALGQNIVFRWLDQPCEWEATYNNGCWSTRRVKYLDYETRDTPPV